MYAIIYRDDCGEFWWYRMVPTHSDSPETVEKAEQMNEYAKQQIHVPAHLTPHFVEEFKVDPTVDRIMERISVLKVDFLQHILKRMAREAIEVQDACNLVALARSFSDVMKQIAVIDRLQNPPNGLGTDFRNQHPIASLWASKLVTLTRAENIDVFSKAYEECRKLAGLKDDELRC